MTGNARASIPTAAAGDAIILYPAGDFDLANRDLLATAVHTAIAAGHRDVRIDLGSVRFIDCSVLHTLLECQTAARDARCQLRVVNASGEPAFVLAMTATSRLLCLPDTDQWSLQRRTRFDPHVVAVIETSHHLVTKAYEATARARATLARRRLT